MLPEPRVLAFDTSAAHCAAALLLGDRIVTRIDDMAKGQAEHLMPMLEKMLTEASLTWKDLTCIGVGTGPGNFTGIRISVAAARGLALGLGIPAVGVDGFAARAYGLSRPVTVTIPAPRGQHYRQSFLANGAATPPEHLHGEAGPQPDAESLVAAIARIAAQTKDQTTARPAPLYVRSADAAPPRDPAPVLLG